MSVQQISMDVIMSVLIPLEALNVNVKSVMNCILMAKNAKVSEQSCTR